MSNSFMVKSNEINDRMEEIDRFLFFARGGGFWEKLVIDKKIRFFNNIHGRNNEYLELRLNKELTKKIIKILEEERNDLELDLQQLIKNKAIE